jgi:CRP/FNR family transcriptional regulator, cyclic AMP receptor protein
VDEETLRAVRASRLAPLASELIVRLLADASSVEYPVGSTMHRAGVAHAALVVRGMVRVFLSSPSGRQITVRYGRTPCWGSRRCSAARDPV